MSTIPSVRIADSCPRRENKGEIMLLNDIGCSSEQSAEQGEIRVRKA